MFFKYSSFRVKNAYKHRDSDTSTVYRHALRGRVPFIGVVDSKVGWWGGGELISGIL